jgi:glycosyltransferase involved in cell wall biosynthesis
LRILYLSDSIIPSRTANSINVMKMCTAFSRIGNEVVLLTIKRPGSHQKDVESDFDFYGVEPLFEIRKFYVPQMKSSIFLYSLRCAIETLKIKPDVVYGRFLRGVWLAAMLGFETIYEMHFTERQMPRVGRLLFSNLVKKRKLKHLVVISQALKEMIEDNVSRKKIIVAHDGADLIGNNNKEVQTELFDPRGQKTKVGYIGHLYPGRGIELIFKMARELPGIDFHIIGGAEEDIKTRKREAEGKNIFFHGFVPPSLINSYIRHCDILVMPYQRRVTISGDKASDTSRWMSPLKMFEYMASGRPIIASDLPVLREVLDHERNAILVVPDDINGWVRSIQFLADDQKTRERLAKQALIDLKQSYTWERRAQRVLAGN